MDCNGNIYNIGMGCCEPMLGPIENYYTKPATDRRIQEEISGISAVTIDEVQEMIDEAVSGITVSGVTEEELNEAIASAKTQIEAEIPIVPTKVSAFENDVPYLTEHQSLSGYATEQWVEDKHYITGVDLSDYSTTEQMNNAITAATDGLATTAYVNTQISAETGDFIDGEELSSYTYDKATIDDKIASGGTFDPTQYYNKTATDALLANKLNTSDFNSYSADTKTYIDNKVSEVSGSTNTLSGDVISLSGEVQSKADATAVTQVNNALTAHTADTGVHVTSTEKTTWNNKQNQLTAGSAITISADTISFNLPIASGSGRNSLIFNGDSNNAFGVNAFAEGFHTNAQVNYSHAEGIFTTASGEGSHTEGQQTRALNRAEHASGYYNVSNKESDTFGDSGNTLFSIGNGTEINARHNAFEVRQNGDIYLNDGSKLQDNLASSTEKTTWNSKQDTLTAGTGVNINGNVISMKIWSGTKAQFDAITVKDNETIYLVTD